jgi:hypothetical protein
MTTTRERPLALRSAEVRAVLDGRKTQVRAVVHPQPQGDFTFMPLSTELVGCGDVNEGWLRCPLGRVGDRLWVREPWCLGTGDGKEFGLNVQYRSAPWCLEVPAERRPAAEKLAARIGFGTRRSPITMPRWASRITLEITEVRVERLADISEEDAVAEGSPRWITDLDGRAYDLAEKDWIRWSKRLDPDAGEASARGVFAALWERTSGKKPGRSWADSPWVWAITFRRFEC